MISVRGQVFQAAGIELGCYASTVSIFTHWVVFFNDHVHCVAILVFSNFLCNFSVAHRSFKSVVFICMNFSAYFQLLSSNVIFLWSEYFTWNHFFLSSLRLNWCPTIWLILKNASGAHKNHVYSAFDYSIYVP